MATSNRVNPLDIEQFRTCGHRMVDFIADYYKNIDQFSVRSAVQPGYLSSILRDTPPKDPESFEDILDDVTNHILPGTTHWQSPSFFAYFPANSSTAGLMGEFLSAAVNSIGFSWIASPAQTELEIIVLDWLATAMGLPDAFSHRLSGRKGGGVIQGTASEAVVVAMLAAKKKKLGSNGFSESDSAGRLVAYGSDQSHSCVKKACMVLGILHFRALPTTGASDWALLPSVVSAAIDEDIKDGKIPFFICSTVGTTSSTAVDPIDEISDIADAHAMWHHVDAAFAGSALICDEFRHYFHGLHKVDSFCFNAHKWLLTNFDCSCLWVKDSKWLVNALSIYPEFLRNKATDSQSVVDFKDWQIPLGRRFRSLKLWMVIRMYGISGLQSFIRKHVDLAAQFEELVRSDSRFQIMAPRTFSLVCFRLVLENKSQAVENESNSQLLEAINGTGDVFLTHTVLDGKYTIRMAIGSTRTEIEHVKKAWEIICFHASKMTETLVEI